MTNVDGYVAALLLSGAAFVGGLGMIARAFRLRRQRELMQDTPTEDVESASVGPTEVTGVALPVDEPIPAPFTDDECVLATWTVEEWDESGKTSEWETVDEGVDSVPFYVDDGTGRLLVEPADAGEYEVAGADEIDVEVGVDAVPPDPVARFLERADTPGDADDGLSVVDLGNQHGDRRYYQGIVEPDETVYVYGNAQIADEAAPTNPANLVIRDAPDDEEPMFLISDRTERELVSDRRWVMWRVPVGAVVSTLGLGGLIVLLAPLVGVDVPLF